MALDRRDRERELVSALLAALHPGTLDDNAVSDQRAIEPIGFFAGGPCELWWRNNQEQPKKRRSPTPSLLPPSRTSRMNP